MASKNAAEVAAACSLISRAVELHGQLKEIGRLASELHVGGDIDHLWLEREVRRWCRKFRLRTWAIQQWPNQEWLY